MADELDEELEEIRKKRIEEIKKKKEGPDYPDSPISVSASNFKEVIDRYPVVVVEFRADWCGACKSLDPLIDQLATKYSGEAVFGRVNVDSNPNLVRNFQVSGVPTLLVAKDGEIVDKMVGVSSPQNLESKIRNYINQ